MKIALYVYAALLVTGWAILALSTAAFMDLEET